LIENNVYWFVVPLMNKEEMNNMLGAIISSGVLNMILTKEMMLSLYI